MLYHNLGGKIALKSKEKQITNVSTLSVKKIKNKTDDHHNHLANLLLKSDNKNNFKHAFNPELLSNIQKIE